MDKPEFVLPIEVVEDYQETRQKLVADTEGILEGLRVLSSGRKFPPDLVNSIADQLLAELTPVRLHLFNMMSDYFATLAQVHQLNTAHDQKMTEAHTALFAKMVELHISKQQVIEISTKYNELVEALEHGDMTHDLTDAFIEEIHEYLEMGWESDLLKAVMRSQKVNFRVAEGIIAAIEGDHIPVAHRHEVATALMRLAAQVAHSIPDSPDAQPEQPQIADGMEAEIVP